MMQLGILGSTRGTNLDAIVTAMNSHQLAARIDIVLSNKSDALILERARAIGLASQWVDVNGLTREEYDRHLTAILKSHAVDLVVLIGYMRILSAEFIASWRHKIINVHPSLLPAHAGKMDLDVHRSVLAAGDLHTGCTVHYVTEEVDAGPLILQSKCTVYPSRTPEELKSRVQQLEGPALVEAIRILANEDSHKRSGQ